LLTVRMVFIFGFQVMERKLFILDFGDSCWRT
jgi:hypothetical protein